MAFDPLTGEDSTGKRFRLDISDMADGTLWLPEAMKESFIVKLLRKYGSFSAVLTESKKRHPEISAADIAEEFVMERNRHDFPFWAASFVKIKRKGGGEDTPFILNYPQRKLVELFEEMRTANEPIRVILLKARQWGGSTCTQIYMGWLQLVHRTGLNSLIIAHQGTGSDEIMDMFDRMIRQYRAPLFRTGDEDGRVCGVSRGGVELKRVGVICK